MSEIINDAYMLVTENNGIFSLIWKNETKSFTDEEFKKEAVAFAEGVKKLQSKKILVDMRGFQYQLSDEILKWRNENIISVYNQVGVEKFAFVSEKPAVKQDNPENTFVTMTFSSIEEAIEWLKEE